MEPIISQLVEVYKNNSPSQSTSALKRVPVIVMIAMSPLTTANNVNAKIPTEPVVAEYAMPLETLELPLTAPQQTNPNYELLGSDIIKSKDGTKCKFGKYRLSDGLTFIAFNYSFSNKNYASNLMGVVRAICSTVNDDETRSSYMIYEVMEPNAKIQGTRICKINGAYAHYLRNYARNEGKGVIAVGNDLLFSEKFGDKALKTAPRIKDEINHLVFKDGSEAYIVPASEFLKKNK